jgi:hypothetical protein
MQKPFKKLYNPTMEELFKLWADEAEMYGYIDEILLTPNVPTFLVLPESISNGGKKLFNSVTYTPDGIIKWNKKARNVLFTYIEDTNKIGKTYFLAHYDKDGDFFYSFLDVKAPPGANRFSDTPYAFTKKLFWINCGYYVNKVVLMPQKKNLKRFNGYLWGATFTPTRYFWTDKLTKERTIKKWPVVTVQEFMQKQRA